MVRIESAALSRPFYRKDHDRIFVDDQRHIYAVFDGAGYPYASDLALSTITELTAKDTFDTVAASHEIQRTVLGAYGGRFLTTACLLHIDTSSRVPERQSAACGDSPLYSYNHDTDVFLRETTDESQRMTNHIDARNFIGSPHHQLRQTKRQPIEGHTSYALVSDGITDTYYNGHLTDEAIQQTLRAHPTAKEAAAAIMNQAAQFDDASVLVVTVQP